LKNVYVCCEGQTETMFVRNYLSQYMGQFNISMKPIILNPNEKTGQKGGISKYSSAKKEITIRSKEHKNEYVTTMIDYYGFPFNQVETIEKGKDPETWERIIQDDIGQPNCIFHFDVHEFESILFVDPEAFRIYGKKVVEKIAEIRMEYPNPETINSRYESCPSRRLMGMIDGYGKVMSANQLMANLDIDSIRRVCPHFNKWIQQLSEL